MAIGLGTLLGASSVIGGVGNMASGLYGLSNSGSDVDLDWTDLKYDSKNVDEMSEEGIQASTETAQALLGMQDEYLGATMKGYGAYNAIMGNLVPGWSELKSQASKNTQQLLKGELPQDVSDNVMRTAAQKGIMARGSSNAMREAMGGYGSLSGRATLRDLGKTSWDAQQTGFSQMGNLWQLGDQSAQTISKNFNIANSGLVSLFQDATNWASLGQSERQSETNLDLANQYYSNMLKLKQAEIDTAQSTAQTSSLGSLFSGLGSTVLGGALLSGAFN